MAGSILRLRRLSVNDADAFCAAVRESQATDPAWPFAFDFDPGTCFADYVARLDRWSKGNDLPDGWVAYTYLIAVVGDAIVGRVSIRHTLNDFLARIGGHIGYGVIPAQRRKGYATTMLRQALPIASALGVSRALVTCDDDNIASARVIEKNGGLFEGMANDPSLRIAKRRYWICLSPAQSPD